MQYLRLGGFDTEAIHSYLEKCVFLERSEELKSYIDKNVYAYELAQNPFMLTAMLDTKSTFAVKNFLDKITDAIVTRRMNQKVLAMNEHEIKAVLSYLAFYISFCEEGEIIALEKIHISNIIRLHEIQRLVCENNIYDYDFDNNLTFNQTTYSAIVGGKTVCAGYGRAMNYIANLCDIDVESVVTPEHLFNYYIEGDYAYLMDLTWDDAEPVRYNYFLIGSETLNKIDNSTHHTALEYNVFPTLALSDYAKPYEEPETTEPEKIIEVETTTPEETTPYIEPTTPYAEPTLPYIEPTTPYIEPTTQEEIIPEPTTIYEEQTTPYIDTEASFVAHRTQAEADEMLDRNPITLIPYKGNNYVGESYVIFVLQYLESREENTEVKEIYFSQDENIAFWECGLFLKAGKKNGTTIVGVKACIDGVMRTDHIMVTVNNGKFVSIMFEKH
ncbi:MAG: hypothetical protein U0M55_05205 [Butyrivibrio sp.]